MYLTVAGMDIHSEVPNVSISPIYFQMALCCKVTWLLLRPQLSSVLHTRSEASWGKLLLD